MLSVRQWAAFTWEGNLGYESLGKKWQNVKIIFCKEVEWSFHMMSSKWFNGNLWKRGKWPWGLGLSSLTPGLCRAVKWNGGWEGVSCLFRRALPRFKERDEWKCSTMEKVLEVGIFCELLWQHISFWTPKEQKPLKLWKNDVKPHYSLPLYKSLITLHDDRVKVWLQSLKSP